MKILLLSPQPFYQERGTPIAVKLMLQILSKAGHEVDLLTYAEGENISLPGLTIRRIGHLPFIRNVPPGPSWKKLVCDILLFTQAWWMATRKRYQLVHAVEESAVAAWFIKKTCGVPYLYDMDSSMAEQVIDKYPRLSWLGRFLRAWEARLIRNADAVVPVCDALAETAARHQPKRMVVLNDISLLEFQQNGGGAAASLRQELGIAGPVAMYVGNLERYQGIDLLLESFAIAHKQLPEARLVVIGGSRSSVSHYKNRASDLGIAAAVVFTGPRPVSSLGRCLESADVLVSPRLLGGNTPMKIYSYLHSGKAVLATDLPTHTQVLTRDVAALAKPEPEAMAQALVQLLRDPSQRARLGQAARALIEERHTFSVLQRRLTALYEQLGASLTGGGAPKGQAVAAGVAKEL